MRTNRQVSYNRVLNNSMYNFQYERINNPLMLCVYCSDHAVVYDHIPPISLAYQYHGHFIIVPSCKECNSFLSNKPIITLPERKKHIIKTIYKRRKNILKTPHWGEEIDEITGWVNRYVKGFIMKKHFLLNKIKCLEEAPEEEFKDIIKHFEGIYEKI